MKKYVVFPLATILLMLLAACTTTSVAPQVEKDYASMYVRGVFTWWEADENYRLKQIKGKVYSASAKLIADGQPYDFKFADAAWTPGMSCGAASQGQSTPIALGQSLQASCNTPQGNFQFTPEQTGTYAFVIDFTDKTRPQVTVEQVNE